MIWLLIGVAGCFVQGLVIYFAVQMALNDHMEGVRRHINTAADRIVKAINTR